jgi:hypothetical protein
MIPLAVTWGATAFVAFAVCISAIPYWHHPHLRNYDLEAAVLAITAVALFWTAYFTRDATQDAGAREATQAKRRRLALAEAMETELVALVPVVHAFRAGSQTAWVSAFDHPVLDKGLDSAELFQLATVRNLAATIAALATLRGAVNSELERRRTSAMTAGGGNAQFIRVTTAAINIAVAPAKIAIQGLQRELTNELKEKPDVRPGAVWGCGDIELPGPIEITGEASR